MLVIALVLAATTCVGPASPAVHPWTGRYTVRAGDSLTAIAQRFGVSLPALADVNGLDPRSPLLIGTVLRVPSPRLPPRRAQALYLVRPGDTLGGIALRYRLSVAQLAAANGIDPSKVLLAGVRLRIPAVAHGPAALGRLVESDPYRHRAVGYDLSYPNCADRAPAAAFAVIGLNRGRPFTKNPCFEREWAAAQPPRSVYVNTAYSSILFRHVTAGCLAAGRRRLLRPAAERAYAVGCSEAVEDLRLLAAIRPLAIWLDVEPGNSWSSRRTMNAATIEGILDRLLADAPHTVVGVYSSSAFWRSIVGGWAAASVPEWVATDAPDPPGCPSGFASGPVWLGQYTGRPLDRDIAC